MTTLYYKDGSSDKVYQACIKVSSFNSLLYDVEFAYGRRGSTMTTGKKNTSPLPKDEAEKMLAKLLREKIAKGYTEGEDGTAYKATDKEDRFTGILPMLLNPIGESEVQKYIDDDYWTAEEKYDGVRMMLRKNTDGTVDAINHKGLLVGAPQVILDEAAVLEGTFVLDGECVGNQYYAFDLIIMTNSLDLRKMKLFDLLKLERGQYIHYVPVAETKAEKTRLLNALKTRGAEGIVFKYYSGYYKPGRPASGGDALKFKFTKTASVIVTGQMADKRSVFTGVYNSDGIIVDSGKVTILPNQDMPKIGTILEVRYLYAYKESGHLYQPVCLGPRTDLDEIECQYSQLKFKNESEEDES